MVFFPNPQRSGTDATISFGDGYTILVRWFQAQKVVPANKIAYNIYYSTVRDAIFTEGPKYLSADGYTEANIINLTPGQLYHFCVRPIEYDPTFFDATDLPLVYDHLRFYPSTLLRANISATDEIIPLVDVDDFPPSGVVKIGVELLQYSGIDIINKNLIIPGPTTGVPVHLFDQINKSINNATNASPIAITTTTPHGLTNGQLVIISGVVGNTAANGTWVITTTGLSTFTLNGSTGNGSYVSGGTIDGYYSNFSTNVGDGYINNLTPVTNSGAITEDWTILCVNVQRDGFNQPIANTAKFTATGAFSGTSRDGYGNPIIWTSNNVSNTNGIFTFSIIDDGYVFREGDAFSIKVVGATPGTPGGRGYNNTNPRPHTVNGFDGYFTWDPVVRFYLIGEDQGWDKIFLCQSRFEYMNYHYTEADGYHQVLVDLLSTDLSDSDADNVDFPMYDYAGYHRTDPVLLLNGTCVGSYIGGEMGCIDKYGNYNIVRGLSVQDQNNQREEMELSLTGRDAILIRRVNKGITCSCYLPSSEYPDDRCPLCYGTKFVFGYEQYFNPRSSNGRIKVRVGPTAENLKMHEAGLESEFPLDMWTLTVPTIKTRDIIVLFDTKGINEEFRYEVGDVVRNDMLFGQQGGQHLKTFRIRKFDPAYQVRIFRDSSDFPQKLNTTIGFVPGIPPHTHEIVVSEQITAVGQINQTTAVSQGHNHPIVNGVVMEVLGHTHTIILP